MYRYGLATAAGLATDGAAALGIEVTDPALALLCGLGNLDPQHAPGAPADAPAAIEAALSVPLPPPGALLVTQRPDLDAVGAMAVLSLRAGGRAPDAALVARVARIAAVDRFDRGAWPGPRPLPATAADLLAEGIGAEMAALAAASGDARLALGERVAVLAAWLDRGAPAAGHARAAEERAERLLASLARGGTLVAPAAGGRIGTVVSAEPGALGLAYRLAPVVLALNPAHVFPDGRRGAKYTLARWAGGDAELDRALARIALREAGWGGQRGIRGSPQDRPSALGLGEVTAALAAALPGAGEGRP